MKIQQKTKISNGGGNTIRSTIPFSIGQVLDVQVGDKIEWTVETDADEIIAYVRKVPIENIESNK